MLLYGKKIMVLYKRNDFINFIIKEAKFIFLFPYRAMPPKRRRAPIQEVDLAAQLNELRQMMLAQQQEIGGLRAQLVQQN